MFILFKTIHHEKGSLHRLQAAYTRQELWFFSSETVVAESGFVANTRMGRSHTIVSTSNMAGACHMASAVGLGDSSRVGNGALVVTNSKWRRHFKLTVNGIKIYTCIYSFHLRHSQSWHQYDNYFLFYHYDIYETRSDNHFHILNLFHKIVSSLKQEYYGNIFAKMLHKIVMNRMAWQWADTLVEIRVTLADIRGTTKKGCRHNFPKHEFNRPVCLEAHIFFLLAHLSQ